MIDQSSKKSKNHLRDILLLIAIPAGLLILTASYVYGPRIFANPRHDFIFAACADYVCNDSYEVGSDGTITRLTSHTDETLYRSTTKLYYYDVKSDATRLLSSDEARNYRIDNSSRSPDGYILEHEDGSNSGFIFFYSRDHGGWYLKNGMLKKPVTLPADNSYYNNRNIQFLGWIK